jgi:hypothetical protein
MLRLSERQTIDPAKTQRLVQRLPVRKTLVLHAGFVAADKELRGAPVILLQPGSEPLLGCECHEGQVFTAVPQALLDFACTAPHAKSTRTWRASMTAFLRCPRAKGGWRFLLLLLLALLPQIPASAQDAAVSATMLRVLAEAADAHRTGQPVYLVADYRYPHNIIGQVSSSAEAERLRADSGSTFGIFGPYVTPAEVPPESEPRIIGVRLVIQTPRGRFVRQLDPRVDALFLTMSAVDKFMVPYYAKVYGADYANRLRDSLSRPNRPGCHIQSSPCFPAPWFRRIMVMDPLRP